MARIPRMLVTGDPTAYVNKHYLPVPINAPYSVLETLFACPHACPYSVLV